MATTGPMAQPQPSPRRPTVDAAQSMETPKVMDVRRLYSTANGAHEAKPFSSLDLLDKSLIAGLDKMGFEFMSPVQQKVLTELPSLSSDCLVQAKTGTGKTAAFLLPALQNLLNGNRPPRGMVALLVICPTRELAIQIKDECNSITACLQTKIECHTAFGGTARASSLRRFLEGDPTVLVATPGRLDDILGDEAVRDRFDQLKTVVLDEADRMLDQGFAPAIFKILKHLPPKSVGWQGMCFSATIPDNVNNVVKCVLFPGYTSLSTIDKNEAPTVDRVPQFLISVPSAADLFPALHALIETEYKQSPQDFKVVVFGTTANGVGLLFDVFKLAFQQFKVFELHSRLSQSVRTRTTEDFKNATSGILFASDVVGRGMDFPNVGLVIQAGLPSSTEQYIHRVGRTARAGKDGRAVTILFENESFFLKTNPTLPIQSYPVPIASQLEQPRMLLEQCFAQVDDSTKAKAYQAFLGYNKTYLKKLRLDTKGLVQVANAYAMAMGCPEPPMIEKKIIGKMGLKGVPGLRIGTKPQNGY
ncbi:ATP-dependent RNA helicase MSS116, mitochondrial [Dendryphion nanum]|uniref:ATP-dependent RNA helicase n=1 Tax=Dendryphion nanum TaxID=256645 RepID=A0A9P9IES8_9PLEO|nr:ATP-dependent RNA helicase MSS116, mitochondrial [Dendryphion nanum]